MSASDCIECGIPPCPETHRFLNTMQRVPFPMPPGPIPGGRALHPAWTVRRLLDRSAPP
jgi:hypothetical protein